MSLRGFRNRISSFILGSRPDGTPVIKSQYGTTSEGARLQGALNMKANPEIKKKVEEHFARQCGSIELGIAAARKQFPEAYED